MDLEPYVREVLEKLREYCKRMTPASTKQEHEEYRERLLSAQALWGLYDSRMRDLFTKALLKSENNIKEFA